MRNKVNNQFKSQDIVDFPLILTRFASLNGSVTNEAGQSIVAGEVLLMRQQYGLSMVSSLTSLGTYSFAKVPKWVVRPVVVSADRRATSDPYSLFIADDTSNQVSIVARNRISAPRFNVGTR